jgi:hypothetical protein
MIIESKAFLRSTDLAPRPLPPPSPASKLDQRQHKETDEEIQAADGRGGKRVGEELNHTTARKPGPL